jgi:hypothetical protein
MAQPLVTFLPTSKLHLQIQDTPIMHHIPSQLRHFCNLWAIKVYLQHRYSWTIETFESINWDLFWSLLLLALSFNLKLFAIKWANHLQPLNYQWHQINAHHSPNCPSLSYYTALTPLEEPYSRTHWICYPYCTTKGVSP